jgi:hypothetical protein
MGSMTPCPKVQALEYSMMVLDVMARSLHVRCGRGAQMAQGSGGGHRVRVGQLVESGSILSEKVIDHMKGTRFMSEIK